MNTVVDVSTTGRDEVIENETTGTDRAHSGRCGKPIEPSTSPAQTHEKGAQGALLPTTRHIKDAHAHARAQGAPNKPMRPVRPSRPEKR